MKNVYFRGGSLGLEFGKDLSLAGAVTNPMGSDGRMTWDLICDGMDPWLHMHLIPTKAIHPVFTLLVANGKIDPDNQTCMIVCSWCSQCSVLSPIYWPGVIWVSRRISIRQWCEYSQIYWCGLFQDCMVRLKLKLGITGEAGGNKKWQFTIIYTDNLQFVHLTCQHCAAHKD